MKLLLSLIAVVVVSGLHFADAVAQENYQAIYYGYFSPSSTQWLPIADGDSVGTLTYQGHEVPTTDGFPVVAYTCTQTEYQSAGRRVGAAIGICTAADDDGDWYRFQYVQPDPDAWEGTVTCIDGIGKFQGIECSETFRGIRSMGPGWFRGETKGTRLLK